MDSRSSLNHGGLLLAAVILSLHPAGIVRKIRVFNTAIPTEAETNQQIAAVNQSIRKASKIKDKRKKRKTLADLRRKLPPLYAQLTPVRGLAD